jgi:hypothetical protein
MQEFAKRRINFNFVRVDASVDKMVGAKPKGAFVTALSKVV